MEVSIFRMANALVISQDFNTFQSAKMMVIEVEEALMSIKYWSLSSSGSSCRVSNDILIVLVYLSV